MTVATTTLVTAEELLALDDGYRYDLIRRELFRMSPAGFEHGQHELYLGRRIGEFVDERGLGAVVGAETGFVLEHNPDTVLAPDVAFVRADRLPPKDERQGFLALPPDLVVEVASPLQSRPSVERKVAEYLDAGVPLVWVLWPKQQAVSVHRLGREMLLLGMGDVLDGEDVLPGFRLPLVDLFRERP